MYNTSKCVRSKATSIKCTSKICKILLYIHDCKTLLCAYRNICMTRTCMCSNYECSNKQRFSALSVSPRFWGECSREQSLTYNSRALGTPAQCALWIPLLIASSGSDRYVKIIIGWFCASCRCKDLPYQKQRGRCRILGRIFTCKEMYRGTYTHIVSKLGPSSINGIRMVDVKPQSKTPPGARRHTRLWYFTYFYFGSVTCLKSCYFTACVAVLLTAISTFLLSFCTLPYHSFAYIYWYASLSVKVAHVHVLIYRHTHTRKHV